MFLRAVHGKLDYYFKQKESTVNWFVFSKGRQLESWTKNGAIIRRSGLNENRSAMMAERYKGATLFSFSPPWRVDFHHLFNEVVEPQGICPTLL